MKPPHPTIWYIFPPIGGPGLGRYWRAYHLARAWQRLGADPVLIGPGYHHYFVRPDALVGTHTIDEVTYHFIPTQPYSDRSTDRVKAILMFGFGLLWDRGLASLAARRAPDVIIYSSPYPFAYVAAHRLARRYGAGLVFEVRDLWPLSLIEILGLPRWNPFVLAAGACERFAYATADRVASLLPEAATYMAGRGLNVHKFVYLPNGVDVEQKVASVSGTSPLLSRAQALAAAGKFLLVHPGNMSLTTDLFPLLEAANLLQRQGRTDVVVLLVGRGELEGALKLRAREQGLANVEFFPSVDKPEVTALLRIAHAGFAALAAKPIYRYGFSLNKLFDYMLAGLPVVFACDLPPRMVQRAGAVIAVPAGDAPAIAAAVTRLADLSADERARIGARGRELVEAEHNYQTLGQRYLSLIESLRGARRLGTDGRPGPEQRRKTVSVRGSSSQRVPHSLK